MARRRIQVGQAPPDDGGRLQVYLDPGAVRRVMADDVRRGLLSFPKYLLPKYFYDAAGSALFNQITQLPEYYCTRAEQEILAGCADEIMAAVRPEVLVELGSGSLAKADMLLSTAAGVKEVRRYVPFDVDRNVVQAAMDTLARSRPALQVDGVVGDFERHLDRLPAFTGPGLAVFFGSTIGNLDPPGRVDLLTAVRRLLGPEGRLLLGVDLVKDVATLELAYDDPAGVTAAFNRNVLHVINHGLGADFEPLAYQHRSFYDAELARIEMHLVASSPQTVNIRELGMQVRLEAGESIWTESSYKFTRVTTEAMLAAAGLRLDTWRTDSQGRFALLLAAPA